MSEPVEQPDKANNPCAHNPYPGLRPYEENEQHQFFGRDADTQILLDKILTHRLTLLFAATGVGKSSLLKAAVIPQLKSASGKHLDVVYYNDWVTAPLAGLKAEIRRTVQQSANWPQGTQLDESLSLADFVQFCTLFVRPPLVIMLDQFEELFRYRHKYHGDTFKPFINELTGLITATQIPVSVVFSMREDFALELNAFKPKLPTLLFENYYRLERLPAGAARQAIVEPLRDYRFAYEPELLEQLLYDLLKHDPDRDLSSLGADDETETVIPPQLQIVCSQLWQRECANADRLLHLKAYQAAGCAEGLLKNYVEEALKTFSEKDRRVLSRAFDHLVSIQGTKMPHTVATLAERVSSTVSLRRFLWRLAQRISQVLRVPLPRFVEKLAPDEVKETEALQKVLDKLASPDVRILRSQQRERKTWYELYHDMYSGSINDWNRVQKRKMLLRQVKIWGSGVSGVVLVAFFGTVAYVHSVSHHLRLAPGDDNRVEVYRGKLGWIDLFGQHQFISEVGLFRWEVEADKRFLKKNLLSYEDVYTDLIGYKPLEERIVAYVQNGNYSKATNLFSKTLEGGSSRQAKAAARGVFSMKILWVFDRMRELAISDQNTPVNKMALTLFIENTTSFPLENLDDLYENLDESYLYEILGGAYYASLEFIRASPLLSSSYKEDSKQEITPSADWALSDSTTIEELLKQLDSSDYGQRLGAVEHLGKIGDRIAVKALIQLLGDDNGLVKEYATLSLGKIGGRDAIDGLLTALGDDRASVRGYAAKALGLISDNIAVVPLIRRLIDENEYVRSRVAEALGLIGDHSSFASLIPLLSDKKETVRSSVAEALGRIGDRASIDGLLKALANDTEIVRRNAAEALGRIGDLRAIDGLLKALANDTEIVRRNAAEALGRIGDLSAIDALKKSLSDDSEYVRHNTVEALGEVGGLIVFDALMSSLGDDDGVVRVASALNLRNIGIPPSLLYRIHSENFVQTYSWGDIFDESSSLNINGSGKHRHQLFVALNLPISRERDQQLLNLFKQTDVHLTIQEKIITTLGMEGFEKKQLIVELHALKLSQPRLINAVDEAIQKLEAPITPGTQTEININNMPKLKDEMNKLEQQFIIWQKFRSSSNLDDATDSVNHSIRVKQVKSEKNIIDLAAFDYAYGLSSIDPGFGVTLLGHHLVNVRRGAYTAFMIKANIQWLDKLDQARERNRNDPIFRHAAFRAIDLGLWRLETLGNKDNNDKEYKELMAWQKKLEADQSRKTNHKDANDPDDEVLERLQWTIMMMKHTKKMTAKFAKDGWVRDWPENVMPVNQPYPELKP